MGGGGPIGSIKGLFSTPKAPAPPPVPPPPKVADETKAFESRLRRQQATGSLSNIKSNIAGAVSDEDTKARISKLLG